MAIVLEEEKKPVNWFGIVTAVIVVGVIFTGGYFLFFKKPELIEVVAPGKFQDISKISQLTFDPEELLNSPQFKALKQFGVEITVPQPGRTNPFRPY